MALSYLNEYRYTVTPRIARDLLPVAYLSGGPNTDFESSIQAALAQANSQFLHEEFALALDSYRELSNLILSLAHPELPVAVSLDPEFQATRDPSVLDAIVGASARMLTASAVPRSRVPSALRPGQGDTTPFQAFALEGLVHDPVLARIDTGISQATAAAAREDWTTAQSHFRALLGMIPDSAVEARARVAHDLAVAQDKAGNGQAAIESAQEASRLLEGARIPSLQAASLQTLAGILARNDRTDQAAQAISSVGDFQRRQAVMPVVLETPVLEPPGVRVGAGAATISGAALSATAAVQSRTVGPILNAATVDAELRPIADPTLLANAVALAPQHLLSGSIDLAGIAPATLAIRQESGPVRSIAIDKDLAPNLHELLGELSTTLDLKLLCGWWRNPHLLIAYLPHIYFFVIPVAIGDCLAELGEVEAAEASYLSALSYPFINQQVEILSLWTKLANLYLEQGDALYRAAGNDLGKLDAAKAMYERVVRSDNTLDTNLSLYKDPQFASMKARVTAFLALAPGAVSTDNPAVVTPVLQSVQRLGQIAAELNYFGFPPNYAPPFSFEYLQTQARYLAEQASRIDQAYINFKSTAENEEFRREQMDQQAALASATVELQQRNLAEVQSGMAVARATLGYAQQQQTQADTALATFINTFSDLIDIAQTQAALGAITLPTFQGRPASDVAGELAGTQSMLSSEMEGQRLLAEFLVAGKYITVAQAQLDQAQKRVAVAQQSLEIAKLQQRYATENRDFLDRKEFSAGLWYELAKFTKRLSRRYLDMAIEVAFLMERAYALETGRELARIRFDYLSLGPGNLLGADLLQADIDSFALDYLATTRSKKAPMKMVISLAAQFPSALFNLRQSGSCIFETTLEQLDRAFPGIYLAKVRNVAVSFIGLFTPQGIVGTLRNTGVSRFRDSAGQEVQLVYPADILPLSAYEAREDALSFRFNPAELRIFENSGVGTAWRLDLPLDANDVDFSSLVDVRISLFFDAFINTDLEASIRAALPASASANSAFSLSLFFPDELFFLKNQGSAVLHFDRGLFPFNQVSPKTTRVRVRVGGVDPVGGLRLHLASKAAGGDLEITSDAKGLIDSSAAGSPLASLVGQSPLDDWTLTIKPEENPALVKNGKLDPSLIDDIQVFIEYSFDFRK